MKRAIGIIVFILAVGIAVIPQLTKCPSPNMTCNYTAKAELALAIPLAIEGLVLIFGYKQSMGLALVGIALGVSVILISQVLIGVCESIIENMDCQTIMKPSLLVFGLAVVLANIWLLLVSRSKTT